MARKKRTSPFEDLIDIAAMLPWWAGVALAAISYIVLHQFAGTGTTPTASNVTELAQVAQKQLIGVLCSFGQYLLPAAFLIGAGISAWRNANAEQLLALAKESPTSAGLADFSWQEFERLVGQAFRERGFDVVESGGGGADGGIDLVMRMGKDKYYVQCKHWKAKAVGVAPVRELFGVMKAHGAVGGFVVASGPFTEEAENFARGRAIELIDAVSLISPVYQKVGEIRPSPSCPKCGAPMTKRTAKKGNKAGSAFWGCRNYPGCRSTLPIDIP